MSLLPDNDRILLGPGPSLTPPRVMRALAAPTVGHPDPLMMRLLDDARAPGASVARSRRWDAAYRHDVPPACVSLRPATVCPQARTGRL